jgi:hypothetical protein
VFAGKEERDVGIGSNVEVARCCPLVLQEPNQLDVGKSAADRPVVAGCPGSFDKDLLVGVKLRVGFRSLSSHDAPMQRVMKSVLDIALSRHTYRTCGLATTAAASRSRSAAAVVGTPPYVRSTPRRPQTLGAFGDPCPGIGASSQKHGGYRNLGLTRGGPTNHAHLLAAALVAWRDGRPAARALERAPFRGYRAKGHSDVAGLGHSDVAGLRPRRPTQCQRQYCTE